jgi:tetratricopeptide (TPR) repeat protein
MRSATLLALTCLLSGFGPPALAQVAGKSQLNIVHPLPPQTPPWVEGYQVRWPVRVVGDPAAQPGQTLVVSLPTGGWLKPDASDLLAQNAEGKTIPLAVLSHDPAGDTLVQFKRRGNDPWYWVYGVSSKGPPAPRTDAKTDPAFREGVTFEVREWAGDDLTSWAKVRAGLEKSTLVEGNGIVTEVTQSGNPARPEQSSRFAVSYRGFFTVAKEGAYRFVVSAEDASFLFIDGFKVFERTGTNATLGTIKIKDLQKLAVRVDLKPGAHAFEVHQAVGDRPTANGICALLWAPPDQPKFAYLPPTAIAHPLYGRAAALEKADGESAGPFVHGLDDSLEVPGLKLFLVRFEASGPDGGGPFVWDFGDGTEGKGRSLTHVYFKEGDYPVRLTSPSGLPAFRRRVHVWPEPNETSPLSLGLAVRTLAAMEWAKLGTPRIKEVFTFLTLCEQPERWPLLDAVAQHLLAQKEFDLATRAQLYVARIEAQTELGRAADALKLVARALPEFKKTPALQVRLRLAEAAVHQYHFRDVAAAGKIYKAILDEHGRVEHPNVRLAAIRWGDLFAEAGDLVRADQTYRIAATLGGETFATATTQASTRGALLRIAEQKLRAGDIHATRQLLERLEMEYPGRRLDGLYCFLCAEAARFAGRHEDALRHYEMIFKLPQWAGYRDRATYGIADTYARMGELTKALEKLGDLKDGFPKLYKDRKADELENAIREQLARARAGRHLFKEFSTGFEPDEAEWYGDLKDNPAVRVPGMRGPHALLLDCYSVDVTLLSYLRPLENLTPGGHYWVEIWYRDLVRVSPPAPSAQANVQMSLASKADPSLSASGQPAVIRGQGHHWHKIGAKLTVPLAHDFNLALNFYFLKGAFLFDRLSVRPISDRQLDALTTFQEGLKTP